MSVETYYTTSGDPIKLELKLNPLSLVLPTRFEGYGKGRLKQPRIKTFLWWHTWSSSPCYSSSTSLCRVTYCKGSVQKRMDRRPHEWNSPDPGVQQGPLFSFSSYRTKMWNTRSFFFSLLLSGYMKWVDGVSEGMSLSRLELVIINP